MCSYAVKFATMQVDVVYIGNLHVQHLQSALMLFEAGKPVLCEKPMTTSPRNAAAMIQAAKEKDTFLMEVGDSNLEGAHCPHFGH